MSLRAVAYARASADESADPVVGIDAQLAAARSALAERGWELVAEVTDSAVSAAVSPSKRPGLGPALRALDDGAAGGLVVTSLDRVTRSPLAWAEIVERSRLHDWTVLATAEGMDLRTDSDRMLAAVARAERRVISIRTKEAVAAAKARGTRLGRPVEHSDEVRRVVGEARAEGATLQQIADRLTAEGFATPRGGRWYHSTVRSILNSAQLDADTARIQASSTGTDSHRDARIACESPARHPDAAAESSGVLASEGDVETAVQIAAFSALVRDLLDEPAELLMQAVRERCSAADIENLLFEIRWLTAALAAAAEGSTPPSSETPGENISRDGGTLITTSDINVIDSKTLRRNQIELQNRDDRLDYRRADRRTDRRAIDEEARAIRRASGNRISQKMAIQMAIRKVRRRQQKARMLAPSNKLTSEPTQ